MTKKLRIKSTINIILTSILVYNSCIAFSQDSFKAKENFQRGIDLLELNKHEDAEIAFLTAISYDSTGDCGTGIKGCAYSKLGKALYMQSDFKNGKIDHTKDEEALPILRKAIELNPENPESLTSIGVVYIVLQKDDSAKYYINRAVDRFPTYAPVYYQKHRITNDDLFPEEAFKYLNLFFKYYDSDKPSDKLMFTSAQLLHLKLQKKLGMLTLKMFQDTLQTYYVNQCDSIVDYSIQVFNYPTTSAKDFDSGLKGFYSSLFSKNPIIKKQIEAKIDEFTQPDFYNLFDTLLHKDLSQIKSDFTKNPKQNDFYWGAFFATGDVKYLDVLLKNCQYIQEKKSLNLYLMSGTAMWSLCSNSKRDKLVKLHLETRANNGNKYAKKILRKSPQYFYEEIQKTIKNRFANEL